MKKLFITVCAVLLATGNALPQQPVSAPEIVQGDANACELNSVNYDALARELLSGGERLFVIARLGRGDGSRDILRRRLHNVRTYMLGRMAADRMVFAEGERTVGDGRVEFYIGSTLKLVSLSKGDSDLCVTCCDFDDPNYYGFGKKRTPKAVRKRRK